MMNVTQLQQIVVILNSVHPACIDRCLEKTGVAEDENQFYFNEKIEILKSYPIIKIAGNTISIIVVTATLSVFCSLKRHLQSSIQLVILCITLITHFCHLLLYINQTTFELENACQIIYFPMEYAITSSQLLFFIDGIYVNKLISEATSNSLANKKYTAAVFILALFITMSWSAIAAYESTNITCWFGGRCYFLYWLQLIPRMLPIIMNVVIFVKVFMTIIPKLKRRNVPFSYKKVLKVGVLMLLRLSITEIFSIIYIPATANLTTFQVWAYSKTVLQSLKGTILCIIYFNSNKQINKAIKRRMQIRDAKKNLKKEIKRSHKSNLSTSEPSQPVNPASSNRKMSLDPSVNLELKREQVVKADIEHHRESCAEDEV